MREVIQQRQSLKRRIFTYNLISNVHSGILPMIGAFMIGLFFDNGFWCATGYVTLLYGLIVGHNFVTPYCDKRISKLIKEQLQLEDRVKHLEAINQSLDERRDMMLFDEDPGYWKTLEQLAG